MIVDDGDKSLRRIKKPTLKDVARIAGVSVWTVSNAFSHPDKLKKETLEKIISTSNSLRYIRNGAAAALVSRRTRIVAITVPTINNPLYSDVVAHTQKVLAEYNYYLLVSSHEYEYEREFGVIRSLVERGVDGFIILGSSQEQRTYDLLNNRGVPYVLSLSYDESGNHHTVGFSNFEASYSMADMVARMGHRRVALCGGFHQFNERARDREHGAVSALGNHGIKVPDGWKFQKPFSIDAGRQVFRELWSRVGKPTALICSTDVQALGVLDEAKKHGISVPEDLSVTGFDNIEYAEISSPPLTTVRTPVIEIGVRSAMHLLDLINDKNPVLSERLYTSIVRRASLSAPGVG